MGRESFQLTRRSFVQLSSAATAAWSFLPSALAGEELDALLRESIARLEYPDSKEFSTAYNRRRIRGRRMICTGPKLIGRTR